MKIALKSKLFSLIVLGFVFLLFLPTILNIRIEALGALINSSENIFTPLSKSLLFATLISFFTIVISFHFSLKLVDIPLKSKKSILLTFFIIPFLLGNVSTSFMFKIIMNHTVIKEYLYLHPFYILLTVGLIHLWQFGSMFTYLFWLSLKTTPNKDILNIKQMKLNRSEVLKDIYLPKVKGLIILLFMLSYIYSFYEDVKLSIIFRASENTGAELINHWLYRIFKSDLLVSPEFAFKNVSTYSYLIVFFTALVSFVILAFVIDFLIKKLFIYRGNINYNFKFSYIVLYSIFFVSVTPIIIVFFYNKISLDFNTIVLVKPFLLSIVSAFISTIFAISFSILLRLSLNSLVASFNNRSLLLLTLLFCLLLVPSITILISGFEWSSYFNYNNNVMLFLSWTFGHMILSLPILGGFLIVTHFGVAKREIDFSIQSKSSIINIIFWSFLSRYKAEYIFTFLLSFSIIWNEGLLNKIYSDIIPSFISFILNNINSRYSDYSKGMLFFSISLILALGVVYFWNRIINKSIK